MVPMGVATALRLRLICEPVQSFPPNPPGRRNAGASLAWCLREPAESAWFALTAMSLSSFAGLGFILESPRARADVSFATRSTRHRDRERGVRFLSGGM